MQAPDYVPPIAILLKALRVNRERLDSAAKIAVDARLLRRLIVEMVARAPFSEEFYLETYPDIAEAHAAGKLADLHRHFVEVGFFEGRLGIAPAVDETFYLSLYRDVAQAVTRGEIASATDHYIRQGMAEGRVPNAEVKPAVDLWASLINGSSRV